MSPTPHARAWRARSAPFVCALLFVAQQAGAVVTWTDLGTVSNASDPSVWQLKMLDVTGLVLGATDADLSFGLRNDWNSPGLTVSNVEFGVDGADYFARFSYVTGDDTSHWRDVRLVVDGLLYVDQFGAYNDHLGDPLLGTLSQGGTGEPGVYVLQREIPEVPEPGVLALVGLGLAGIGLARRRGWRGRVVKRRRHLLVCALPALLAASAHAVPLIEAPLPESAYVTKNGYQWAWMFAVAPDGNYAGFVPDMGYQASLGWRLPTRAELDLWAPTPSDFLFPGANVPLGGADPVSNAWFAYPTAALSGPGACASAYFVDRDGYNHCDWGNGPGVGEYWDGADLVDLSLPWWNSSAWVTAGSPTWAETLAVRRIPEPATVLLLGLGLAGLARARRRRTAT